MGNVFRSTFVTYSTVKLVEVNDRRLRFIHVALSFSIIIYTIIILVVMHQGVRFETISGAVNAWEGLMLPLNASSKPPNFCKNSSYNWEDVCYENLTDAVYNTSRCQSVRAISNSWYIKSPTCIQFDGHSHSTPKDTSATARTHISRYYYNCTEWANSSLGVDAPVCLNREYSPFRESYLLQGMDDFSFMMQHSVSTSFTQGLLVPTTIVDYQGILVKSYNQDAIIGMDIPMRTWIAWGGGSFEDPVGPLLPDVLGPKRRAAGCVIELRFTYSNYRKGEVDSTLKCQIQVKTIRGLWGFEGGVEKTNGEDTWIEQYNSVQLHFVMGGQLGERDFYLTLTALLGSTVLLSISRLMTDFIGRTFLQEKEKFRSKTIEAHHDLRRRTEVSSAELASTIPSFPSKGTIDS